MYLVASVTCPACSSFPKPGSSNKQKHQMDKNRNAHVSMKRQIGYLTSIFIPNYTTLAYLMKECSIQKVTCGCIEEKRATKGET